MSKPVVTVFLCTNKDCARAWERACHGSPSKWLKRSVRDSGLPCKLDVVKTNCMDRCEQAGCVCLVSGCRARVVTDLRADDDADQVLVALRSLLDEAAATPRLYSIGNE